MPLKLLALKVINSILGSSIRYVLDARLPEWAFDEISSIFIDDKLKIEVGKNQLACLVEAPKTPDYEYFQFHLGSHLWTFMQAQAYAIS